MTRDALRLDANFVATIDAKLNIGQLEETVTVTGDSPVVDVRSTTVVSNIKEETIALLPTSRSYEDIGKLAPGIRVEGIPDVGGNKTGGGRGTLVNYGSSNGGSTLMLDGVNTDGTAGYFDMGAVEEMIVRPAGNDPEIPTPGHGVPGHRQVGRQRPSRATGCMPGRAAACRATTSTTSCARRA